MISIVTTSQTGSYLVADFANAVVANQNRNHWSPNHRRVIASHFSTMINVNEYMHHSITTAIYPASGIPECLPAVSGLNGLCLQQKSGSPTSKLCHIMLFCLVITFLSARHLTVVLKKFSKLGCPKWQQTPTHRTPVDVARSDQMIEEFWHKWPRAIRTSTSTKKG